MSSIASSGFTITREEPENSSITINTKNSKLILENTSSDVTISKYEEPLITRTISPPTTNTPAALKSPRVLPLVYFKNSSKSFPAINNNKCPKFQIASQPSSLSRNTTTTTTASASTNQNVIFATGKPPPLVLQKPQGNMLTVVPGTITNTSKFAGVFTLKSSNNNSESTNVNTIQINANNIPKLHELPIVNNNTLVPAQSPHQKLKKFIIAPIPKITTNHQMPSTITTNSIVSKLSILPMPVPCTEQVLTKHKVYSNFKITDGKLQNDCSNITMMCDNRSNENSMDMDSNSDHIVCDEIIDLDSPDKSDIANKTYELSITEDSLSSHNEVRSSVIASRPGKEVPKFPKHGVSILKKNYGFSERKVEKLQNSIVSSNSNAVSENKEIVLSEPGTSKTESVIITIPVPTKSEKVSRRKSNFSYRKEFDEVEVSSTSSFGTDSLPKSSFDLTKFPMTVEEPKKNLTSEVEIELVEEKPILKTEECDLQKVLKWDDGLGTLRGSNLKFKINEFNLIEYITDDDYKTIIQKRISKVKEKLKNDTQEEVRCLDCGCYGLPSDFISPKFCSYDCRASNQVKVKKEKAEKMKKKKKKSKVEPDQIKIEKEEDISEEESLDNISQDKLSYPWACKKKGFSWSKYLEHVKAKPAPVKLFKDPFPYTRNGFKPGMKLEGVDPQHPSYFCVLTVAEVVGYRIRLHFDGYPDNYDFWCNADSMDIFPMGWCEKYGHVLQPPSGYKVDNFSWTSYLKATKGTAAPKHLFANRAGQAICPNGFRVGMKLEAVDRKNTSLVCVASVRDMMDNRILVHFDSWDDIYDYWADPTSPYIHPVGWCDQYGHNLTPPNDYPNPESFSWETYLRERQASAAPVRAFKQRPACGFRRGMRLECVDRRVPHLIRVATVDDVKEHQVRVHFDGWPDRYSYWLDDDHADVHPMGWCQKTGHPIEPPLTPDDVYDFLECPTVGCRGQGHIQGPKYSTHSTQKDCPYAEENIDLEKILPDRLLSPDKSPAAVVPVSREPKECKIKPKLGRPPKHPRLETPKLEPVKDEDDCDEESDEPPEKKPKRKYKKRVGAAKASASATAAAATLEDSSTRKAMSFIDESKVLPVERESWQKHSEFLRKYIRSEADPRYWSNREVVNFVSRLPSCGKDSDVFRKEKIDGEAFLSLSQKDVLSLLRLKMGPAVKLYNSIVLLRRHVEGKVFA